MILYSSFSKVQMKHARHDDKVQLISVVLKVVYQVGDNITNKVCGTIALPVGYNAIAPVTLWNFYLLFFLHRHNLIGFKLK